MIKQTAPPPLQSKDKRLALVPSAYAFLLVGLALLQLVMFEKFVNVVANYLQADTNPGVTIVAIALITVSSLGFFFSIFAENSLGPIVATMSVIIVFTILTTLDIPMFQNVKDFFFTSHMIGWKGFFEMKVDADGMSIPGTIRNLPAVLRSAGILLLHIFIFTGSAIFIFNRKDVLS